MKNKTPTQPWNTTCLSCKDTKAFQGFINVECTNSNCKNYSATQTKNVKEYMDYLDELSKIKEKESKNSLTHYYSSAYKPTVDDDDVKEQQRIAYGTYAMYGPVPDPEPDDINNLNNAYDPDGFYSHGCLDNDPCDDPSDKQPIPAYHDDDIIDLFGTF